MLNDPFYELNVYFLRVLQQAPAAVAAIRGSERYPDIDGKIQFYQTRYGVLVAAQVYGLPWEEDICQKRIFALHIHEGGACTGNDEDPFADALTHYDPDGCPHPAHAGDLLPLWGNRGYAWQVFLTDRFFAEEIIGKTVIVHADPDDFITQPAGNAGEKIACGVIKAAPF